MPVVYTLLLPAHCPSHISSSRHRRVTEDLIPLQDKSPKRDTRALNISWLAIALWVNDHSEKVSHFPGSWGQQVVDPLALPHLSIPFSLLTSSIHLPSFFPSSYAHFSRLPQLIPSPFSVIPLCSHSFSFFSSCLSFDTCNRRRCHSRVSVTCR